MTCDGRPVTFELDPLPVIDGRITRDQAAVLVPIVTCDAPFVLLTRRATALRHHPGQISFPGGRIDPTDRDVADAALREASEEIELDRDRVRIAGALPPVRTGSGFTVTPVVGLVDPGAQWRVVPAEVAALVELPLATVLDPVAPWQEMRPDTGRPFWVWPHPTARIWGATAAILKTLAGRCRPRSPAPRSPSQPAPVARQTSLVPPSLVRPSLVRP